MCYPCVCVCVCAHAFGWAYLCFRLWVCVFMCQHAFLCVCDAHLARTRATRSLHTCLDAPHSTSKHCGQRIRAATTTAVHCCRRSLQQRQHAGATRPAAEPFAREGRVARGTHANLPATGTWQQHKGRA